MTFEINETNKRQTGTGECVCTTPFAHVTSSLLIQDKIIKIARQLSIKHKYSLMTNMRLLKGCRSPYSKGIGEWDHAFVIVTQGDVTTSILFGQSGNSFYSTELSVSLEKYHSLVTSDDWLPMTIEDLRMTLAFSNGDLYDNYVFTQIKRKCLLTCVITAVITAGFMTLRRFFVRKV
jgi:hypothetical protein